MRSSKARRASVGGRARLTRDALVVLQVAAALVLLAGAGLMLRTMANLRALELGFRPDHVLTLRTTLPQSKYREPAQRLSFYDRVIADVRTLPGVEGAGYTSLLPFLSPGNTTWFAIDGVTHDPDDPQDTLFRVGTSDYLKTLGVQLVEGRLIDDRDGVDAPRVVVVNEHARAQVLAAQLRAWRQDAARRPRRPVLHHRRRRQGRARARPHARAEAASSTCRTHSASGRFRNTWSCGLPARLPIWWNRFAVSSRASIRISQCRRCERWTRLSTSTSPIGTSR